MALKKAKRIAKEIADDIERRYRLLSTTGLLHWHNSPLREQYYGRDLRPVPLWSAKDKERWVTSKKETELIELILFERQVLEVGDDAK